MKAIKNRIKGIETNQLIDILELLINKHDANSNFVFELVFDELEERLPEEQFLTLCEQIETL